MNDLAILHLSDLHITGETDQYSRLLRSLLDDIKKEIEYINDQSLVVVVTGDILHKADKRANKAALEFFKDLKRILGIKVVGIYIVPGNHDKARTGENKFLIPAYRSLVSGRLPNVNEDEQGFGQVFYKSFWKYHLDSYKESTGSGYIELTRDIYEIFGLSGEEINRAGYVTDTFGVDIKEVQGKKYCFILLNTAWACIDDSDDRNLVLGKFQLDEIKKQFHRMTDNMKKGEELGVTFVMGHHPISALNGKEEDGVFASMISFDELDADVYMCGHTHSRAAINWSNNRHSISTLVTGIGWPERQGGNRVGDHTYSMYVFNIDANSVDVYVKSTEDDGTFRSDLRIYTTEVEKDSRKIVLPIHARSAQTFIPISTSAGRSPKSYYLSNELLKYIQEYTLKIGRLRSIMGAYIEVDKNQIYEAIGIDLDEDDPLAECDDNDEETYFDVDDGEYALDEALYDYLFLNRDYVGEMPECIRLYFTEHKRILFEFFLGFLSRICRKMLQIFAMDDLPEGNVLRFHFRYLADRNAYKYRRLCTSFSSKEEMGNNDVSDIIYGDLIRASYESGCSLVYDVNSSLCTTKLKDKWKNFITVVPKIDQNQYKRRTNRGETLKKPYLTFGATSNSELYNWLFYCMDFFSLKDVLEEMIEQYVLLFGIDIGEFCEWAKRNIEE